MPRSIRRAALSAGAILLASVLAPLPGVAQLETDLKLPDLLSMQSGLKAGNTTAAESRSVPMDSPVDPDYYIVGPGDVLAVNIWSSAPVEHRLTVTPEGILLIPSIGEVNLRGETLTRARTLVTPLVAKKYYNATVSLTLVGPRKLTVHITGEVIKEGMFEMHAVQRVDNLIEEANSLPSTQLTKKFYDTDWQVLRQNASMRYITIQRPGGVTQRVDLVRYALTGKAEWNPYLREGDRVFVPNRRPWDNRIGIYGGVARNLSVEFVPGDSLSHLVRLGLGLKAIAGADRSVLTRLSLDGTRMDTVTVDVPAILAGRAPDVALEAGDRLVVPVGRDEREGNAVRLEGEFVRPGTYPITKKNTHLREIVAMAGGFTPAANLGAASILRARITTYDTPEELEQERLLSLRTSLPTEDSTYYLTETALRLKGEVVAADFKGIFVDGDTAKDVTLRNFDRVIVPAKSGTIYVFGQVISPGHVPYQVGQGADYYVSRAGGSTNDARTGDIKVIKNGTRAWLDPSETAIEDGDFIWVPKERPADFGKILTTVAQLATVIAALASVILVANTL